ncbi:MAG: ferrous iron transporter B [Oscillospiraceae bacterium]|nr:ferrous iron transporter B [Oscillospiraceae bacterium]
MNNDSDRIIALAGNPNSGKSTVFNAVTGLRQHTGNWAGKTVSVVRGRRTYNKKDYTFVDLPGCYSLSSHSAEEAAAREFICSGSADTVIVVCDATCLERSLNLALQIIESAERVIVCVNLMDEAHKKGITINLATLSDRLGVPVVGTSARSKKGLSQLLDLLEQPEQVTAKRSEHIDSASSFIKTAERISKECVTVTNDGYKNSDIRADRIITGKRTAFPIMLLTLFGVFWLTITGANYPSELIAGGLFWIEDRLLDFFIWVNCPAIVYEVLVLGVYRVLAWVVSVMLPPMAIFFPLFTLLEDIGFLPRVAFNLDKCFKKCSACGKQALTMCMGFGCNAAGIIGCRIINSPRERLIAIITNNFVPCNGRFAPPHQKQQSYLPELTKAKQMPSLS